MKKYIIYFYLLLLVQSLKAQNGEIISKGVLYFKENTLFVLPDSISIFNKNGSLSIKLLKQNDILNIHYFENHINFKNNEYLKKIYPYYYFDNLKYNAPIPNIIIRAYYPDYGVFVIDANKSNNNEYMVFINGQWKVLKENNLIFKKWEEFLKDILIKLPDNINLHYQKNINSKKIKIQRDLSFRVLEVEGDWIKIECNQNCEECSKKTKGWVKWRKGNKLIVYLYYVC
jgi:hypothetical protein